MLKFKETKSHFFRNLKKNTQQANDPCLFDKHLRMDPHPVQ